MMPRTLNTRLLAAVGLGVLGLAVVAAVVVKRHAGATAEAAAPGPWQYATNGNVRSASLQSRNDLKQPAPFKSGPATLDLTRGPDGYAVQLDVDGDMACSYAPTASQIQVSFDGAPPRAFACAPAPDDHGRLLFDGAHSTAYLADPVAFLARVRTARHVRITSDFAGQTAPQMMDFDLPPGDPVTAISPTVAQATSEPAPAVTPPMPAPPMATVVPVAAIQPQPSRHPHIIKASMHLPVRRHPAGYYLHPYRPVHMRAYPKRHWGRD